MGALYGELYLDPNQPIDSDHFDRQLARLKHRARGGSSRYVGPGVGLIWANSGAPNDQFLGAQPWIDGDVLLIFDGRLSHRRELADAFDLPVELPTLKLLSQGWTRGRERFLSHLQGHFALVLIDLSQRQAVLQRDNLGARALHWRFVPASANCSASLHFASEAQLLKAPQQGPSEQALAHYFAFQALPETQSFFDGVQVLPAGATLHWSGGDVRHTHRPFEFLPAQKIRLDGACEQFTELLTQAIHEHAPQSPESKLGISLSGGLDSNALLALAAPRSTLQAFSWRFAELKQCDELEFASAHAQKLGVAHTVFVGDHLSCFSDPSLRAVSLDSPRANPYRELKSALYQYASKAGVQTLFNGNFGDHLYFDPAEWLSDSVLRGDFAGMAQELAWRLRRSLFWQEPSLRRLVRRALGFALPRGAPSWMLSSYARSLLAVEPVTEAFSASGIRAHQQRLLIGSGAQFGASGEAEFSERFSIDHATPFRSADLIRFMMALPMRHMQQQGQSKFVLRQALRGRLPEVVRTRAKATSLQPFLDQGLRGPARAQAESLLFSPEQNWAHFYHEAALRQIWQKPMRTDFESALLWSCLSYEHWRRAHGWRD